MIISFAGTLSCNRKVDEKQQVSSSKHEFSWKEELKASDVPDFNVIGFLNGQEVKFEYINFERWHGSNDNVLNFCLSKPEQPCGYIENFIGFRIINKGNSVNQGEFSKPNFTSAAASYEAAYFYLSPNGAVKSEVQWNCVLIIENISAKNMSGKLVLCFNDGKKSWIAGRFDAQVCNN